MVMEKVVKEHYEEIISDLGPLFDKWTVKGIVGAVWKFTRTRSRLQELKDEQIRINKELAQYEKAS